MRNLIKLGIILLASTLFTAPAWGQEVTAGVVGTVSDSSGAPIRVPPLSFTILSAELSGRLRANDTAHLISRATGRNLYGGGHHPRF